MTSACVHIRYAAYALLRRYSTGILREPWSPASVLGEGHLTLKAFGARPSLPPHPSTASSTAPTTAPFHAPYHSHLPQPPCTATLHSHHSHRPQRDTERLIERVHAQVLGAGEAIKFGVSLGAIGTWEKASEAPAGTLGQRLHFLINHSVKMAVSASSPPSAP